MSPQNSRQHQVAPETARLILEALKRGDSTRADILVRELISRQPSSVDAWELDSTVSAALRDPARSAASARRAIEHGGSSTQNWVRLARALWQLHDLNGVNDCIARARAVAHSAACLAQIGDLFTQLEDFPKALEAYDEAARREPHDPRYLYNRAAVRRFMGELEEAERDYDQLIELDPGECEAWLSRADLRRQSPERNHIAALEARLAEGFKAWSGEVPIRYALAKEYEDLGDYARSWQHLAAGAALRRQHLNYNVRNDLDTVAWICEAFPDAGSCAEGCPSTEPIFIVGMPRTGSTLLERIISGHPQVFAAGELSQFSQALVAAAQHTARRTGLSRRELVAISASLDFGELGREYLERTRPRTGRLPRFIDKLPLNYLYCGIIHRALPNARILHMTRDPLATCYAAFKVLFNQGYPFSYDLGELTEYYLGYRRLMEHWQRIMPQKILEVSYERLVCDPETETRRVFDFCNLAWQPDYLRVEKVSLPSTTASASQVRRPIYRDSLELWKHYDRELAPVARRLASAGVKCGT
jgi:tetratricopeptide (TPR) repeat protein